MNIALPDRLQLDNVYAILESYFDRHSPTAFPWRVAKEHVEVGVAFPIYTVKDCLCGHTLKQHRAKPRANGTRPCTHCMCVTFIDTIAHAGRLDLIGQHVSDRTYCPVDHKTSYKLDQRFVNQYMQDSQLTGYMWDVEQVTGEPCRVAYINAIELSVLPGSTRQCKDHGTQYVECAPEHARFQIVGPIERTDRQVAEWKADAIVLAKRYHILRSHTLEEIHMIRKDGTFNGSCGSCEFREWCGTDRSLRQVDAMFQISRWSPYAYAHDAAHPLGMTPNEHTLFTDNSILKGVATCSTQTFMRYALGYSNPEQAGPLFVGIAVHAALEAWFKGCTSTKALEVLRAAYDAPTGD